MLLEVTIAIFLILSLFSGGIILGSHIVNNLKIDKIISESETIDRSLEMYSMAHKSIKTDAIKVSEKQGLQYGKNKVFPANLTELGVLKSKFGYISTNIDLTKYTYTVKTDSNGYMTYELGVTLPNGKYYKSPGSNK